jgi:hypothetical protein
MSLLTISIAVPAGVLACLCGTTAVLLYRRILTLRKRGALERLQLAGGGVAMSSRGPSDHGTPYFDRGSGSAPARGGEASGLLRLLDGLLMDVAQLHPLTGVLFFSFMAPVIGVVFLVGSVFGACAAARRCCAACRAACAARCAAFLGSCCRAAVGGLLCYALCAPECCGTCLRRHCCGCCTRHRNWCLEVRTAKERREFVERVRNESSFVVLDGEAAAAAARGAASAAAAVAAAASGAPQDLTPPPGLRAGAGSARLLAGGSSSGGTPGGIEVGGGGGARRGGGGGGGGGSTPPASPPPRNREVHLDRDIRQSLRRMAGEAPRRHHLSLRLEAPGAPPSLAQLAVEATVSAFQRAFLGGEPARGGVTPARDRGGGGGPLPARTRIVRQPDGSLAVEEEVSDDEEEEMMWRLPAPLHLPCPQPSTPLSGGASPVGRGGGARRAAPARGGGGGARASPLPGSPLAGGGAGASPTPPRATPLPRSPVFGAAAVAPAPAPVQDAAADSARSGASDPAVGSRATPTNSTMGDAQLPTGGGGAVGRANTTDPAPLPGAPSRAALNAVLRGRPQ